MTPPERPALPYTAGVLVFLAGVVAGSALVFLVVLGAGLGR